MSSIGAIASDPVASARRAAGAEARPPGALTNELQVAITVFYGLAATSATEDVIAWGKLAQTAIRGSKVFPSKQDCPLIKLARFGDKRTLKGSLRHDANMIEVTGLEGDHDAGTMTIAQGAERLEAAGIEAILYTTASHRADAPRWRVLVPFSNPIAPGQRKPWAAKLNEALGGVLAPESATQSQSFYWGRVEGVEYEARRVRGQPIDLVLDIDADPPVAEDAASHDDLDELDRQRQRSQLLASVNDGTIDDLASAVEHLDYDDYHVWIKTGQALAWFKGTIDFRAIFNDAKQAGWSRAGGYEEREDKTDAGNANVLLRLANGDLRYITERRQWLYWDGLRWQVDASGGLAQRAALGVAEHYLGLAAQVRRQAESPSLSTADRARLERVAKAYEAWAAQCRNRGRIESMLTIAGRDPRAAISAADLDRDPDLLGVENGVVDLRTGELRAAGRDDLVTRRCYVAFKPDAVALRWVQFIDEITGMPADGGYTPRPALAAYLQRVLGYAMTGRTGEHKMFFAIGEGSNGKNVLLDTVTEIAGGYAVSVPAEALMATRFSSDAERPSPVLASLAGARLAVCSESKDGHRLDVALIKRHTGGGFLTARLMRENSFTFEITHKLLLMTNHRPRLDHLDEALRGRLHLIPFDRRWNRPGHTNPDPSLPDGDRDLMARLREERDGILAWLVKGAVDALRGGLNPPPEVVRATDAYLHEEDLLGQWLETCTRVPPASGTAASELLSLFSGWARRAGAESDLVPTLKRFSTELSRRGVARQEVRTGVRFGLKAPDPLGFEDDSDAT